MIRNFFTYILHSQDNKQIIENAQFEKRLSHKITWHNFQKIEDGGA